MGQERAVPPVPTQVCPWASAAGGKASGGVQTPGPRGASGGDGEAGKAEGREQVFIRSLLAAWSWHLLRTRLSPPSTAASPLHQPPLGLGEKRAGNPHLAPRKHLPIIRITAELGFLSLGPQVLVPNKQVPAPRVPTACFGDAPPAQLWSGSCSLVPPQSSWGTRCSGPGALQPFLNPALPSGGFSPPEEPTLLRPVPLPLGSRPYFPLPSRECVLCVEC